MGGEEGETTATAEVLGEEAVAVGVDLEGGGPVEVELFEEVGAGVWRRGGYE